MSSLRELAAKGASWTVAGFGALQIIRFSSNLVLTRLLFPEAFGLMALVQTFMLGLSMFSDIGIVPSIIQHKNGNEPSFLNTAWTLQVGRGFLLWLGAFLLATPAAFFFKEPMLGNMLQLVGVNAIIQGFNSTKLASANRKLLLGRITLIDIGSYLIGVIIMMTGAYFYRTVWALVWGGLVASFVKMLCSHIFLEGESNRFQWNPAAFQALYQYGRWVFVGTMVTFLAGQGDKLLLGRLFDVDFLAFYSLAFTLNTTYIRLFRKVGGQVLFPTYAKLFRKSREKLYSKLRKIRLLHIVLSWTVALFFIFYGVELIEILYDSRYESAGWILQILATGALIGCLNGSYVGVLMGMGEFKYSTLLLVLQLLLKFILMYIGYLFLGEKGAIIGIAATGYFLYPINALVFSKFSLWQPEVDVPIIVLTFFTLMYIIV